MDVVNGGDARDEVKNDEKESHGMGSQTSNKEGFSLVRDAKWSGRTIEVEENFINSALMDKSESQAFSFETPHLVRGARPHIVANVLNDKEHGLRRWMHKLRSENSLQRTSGRIIWISILGIPISCWGEEMFKKLAAPYGRVLGMLNCRLEGNQNLVYGRVQIHTINKGLINEDVIVTVKGKSHKINIVEEVKEIFITDIQEVNKRRYEDKKVDEQMGDNEIHVDKGEGKEEGKSDTGGRGSLAMMKMMANKKRWAE
ncbi:hypothetical protein Tco_1073133, partial [Tanacetum coccineum]